MTGFLTVTKAGNVHCALIKIDNKPSVLDGETIVYTFSITGPEKEPIIAELEKESKEYAKRQGINIHSATIQTT